MRFRRKKDLVVADVDRVEAEILTTIIKDLLELLGDAQAPTTEDPLAALVGLPVGPVERPEDPALARLLPDAYGDDEQAATDFRRYTEADLRAGKRAHAAVVLATLAPYLGRGGKVPLDRAQADAWLLCLNDLRLVLGTRLEVTEDTELEPDVDDPHAQALMIYGWLGWLQESLLGCLTPGR